MPDDAHHVVVQPGFGNTPDNVMARIAAPASVMRAIAIATTSARVARGAIDKHTFTSALLGNDRNIWVYTPPGYAATDRIYPCS